MYSVTKEIHFCYGHRLQNYEGKCRHVHGHNGKAEIELTSSDLDKRGMVYDFGDIKKDVKTWIDDNMDHVMLLRRDDPLIDVLRGEGEPFYSMDENPTAEAIAEEIYRYTEEQGYPVTAVRLWETPTSYATFEP